MVETEILNSVWRNKLQVLWMNHRCSGNPLAGGAEKNITEVGKYLISRGHEVHLLTGGWHGARRHEIIDGTHIHRYGRRALPHLAHPFYLQYHKEADVIIDDLAHVVPWFSPWLSQKPGVALFRHLHARTLKGQTSFPLAAVLAFLERKYPAIYKSWPFITHSLQARKDLVGLGIAGDRITIIPPGVDTNTFHPDKKSRIPLIVYFGGMRPYKRPEHAILSLKLLIDRGTKAKLVMVGNGPSLPFLQSLVNEMQLKPFVTFTGRLSERDLAELVSSAWVNVHCSLSEGWSISVMEAAASGVPTVAYRVPGLTESVIDTETGYLVDDGDLANLAVSLKKVIEMDSAFERSCRVHSVQYSWDAISQKWESTLKGIL